MSRKTVTLVGMALMAILAAPLQGKQESNRGDVYRSGTEAEVTAPAPWIQQDPGARAYQAARDYLNARRYQEAAHAFYQLRRDYPESGYLPDSYYYQAFALSRLGGRSQLREALDLLQAQQEQFSGAPTMADSRELGVRIQAQLAQQGDARAAASITQQAQEACGPDQEMRLAALNALMNMDSERALPMIQDVLRDRDACSVELRRHAVFLLSQHMDESSIDVLLDLAHRNPDPDPEVRAQAVFWLAQVQAPEAVDALESILADSDDPELQESALFALSQHQGERGAQILRRYAERSDVRPELREQALFWIGQTPGGGEYLRSIYSDLEGAELRANALHSIAQADTEESHAWLMARARDASEEMEVRAQALFWVGQTGDFAVAELKELFRSFDDPEMKQQIIFAASQSDTKETVDFLMEIAQDPEQGELREQAIFWLGQSEDPRVPEFLLRIIGR